MDYRRTHGKVQSIVASWSDGERRIDDRRRSWNDPVSTWPRDIKETVKSYTDLSDPATSWWQTNLSCGSESLVRDQLIILGGGPLRLRADGWFPVGLLGSKLSRQRDNHPRDGESLDSNLRYGDLRQKYKY
jgi:hypothetical protein